MVDFLQNKRSSRGRIETGNTQEKTNQQIKTRALENGAKTTVMFRFFSPQGCFWTYGRNPDDYR